MYANDKIKVPTRVKLDKNYSIDVEFEESNKVVNR